MVTADSKSAVSVGMNCLLDETENFLGGEALGRPVGSILTVLTDVVIPIFTVGNTIP